MTFGLEVRVCVCVRQARAPRARDDYFDAKTVAAGLLPFGNIRHLVGCSLNM